MHFLGAICAQVSTSPALAAGLPRWALWSSAVQVAAAALALAPPLGRRGEARRALSVLAVLASFTSSLALFAILLVYINYMLGTWRSCKALSRASSVAWQLVGLVLQLIALALALVNPPSVPDQRGSLVSLCGNISHI